MGDGDWVSVKGRILVRAPDGAPRLWVGTDGELHDAIGIVQVYGLDACPPSELEIEEIAVFVAEWLTCVAEREGAVAICDVHPDLRPCVRELMPRGVLDEDADGAVN